MGDHQKRYIDYRDCVCDAQLAGDVREAGLVAVVIVDEDVDGARQIESDCEEPEERTYSEGEKRQDGENPRREVAIGGESREGRRQISADDAGEDEDEAEEAETMQNGDGALRFDRVHRLEPRPDISAEAQQPGDVTENEMGQENACGRHGFPFRRWRTQLRTLQSGRRGALP